MGIAAQIAGVVAIVVVSALGVAAIPFLVPLIVATIGIALIGTALIALGNYVAKQDTQQDTPVIPRVSIRHPNPYAGIGSDDIGGAGADGAGIGADDADIGASARAGLRGNTFDSEFAFDRPTMPIFPDDYTLEQKIEEYITGASKAHYKGLNVELIKKQQGAMDKMRNVTLPTADGGNETVSLFRYVNTYPNLDHVVSVDGNMNALISDLNSPGFPGLGYATQFPRFGQMGDFLEAMVHEGISLVNPISQLKDINQHKLYPYWLPENSRVHRTSKGKAYQLESKQIELDNPDYQPGSGKHLYELTISWIDKNGQLQKHVIRALHIDNWQDHGAVGVTELKGYVQARLENEGPVKGKILTHCTAGVGRTGTLIAAQSLIEAPNTPLIDVVDAMRERRSHACVQSNSQAGLLTELDASLKAQRAGAAPPRTESHDADDVEPEIVPSVAPRMRPVLPPAPPPRPPRQRIVQPAPSDSASGYSPRLPRRTTYKPQFDGLPTVSRHEQVKARVEAALSQHPNYGRLIFVPEGEDGKAAVKALPIGDMSVLIWPSNSIPDKFVFGVKTAGGESLYYILSNETSLKDIRMHIGIELDR